MPITECPPLLKAMNIRVEEFPWRHAYDSDEWLTEAQFSLENTRPQLALPTNGSAPVTSTVTVAFEFNKNIYMWQTSSE
jgi:hypothetical protein